MKIKVNNPEQFVTWGNAIGIVLFSREQDSIVNFFTEEMDHSRVKRKELGSPSLVELLIELENNPELRFLAKQNQLITVTDQYELDYIAYANSYN